MCQCWLFPDKKRTILVSDDNEGHCVFWGLGIYGHSLYHFLNFVINLKMHYKKLNLGKKKPECLG